MLFQQAFEARWRLSALLLSESGDVVKTELFA